LTVVFTHTDFRIYWPGRLKLLYEFLQTKGINLIVVEIAGAGSHYYFAKTPDMLPPYWQRLFPERKIEEIPAYLANKALLQKLDELNPDVIFSGAIAFPSGAAAVRWTNDNNKKLVIFDDARLQDVQKNWLTNSIKKRVFSSVDAILCPAPEWNKTFHYFGFSDKQIFHGLNVVDNFFWTEKDKCEEKLLPERYFLSIGRQIPEKNVIFFLKAFKQYLQVAKNPLHIVLIGEGPEHDRIKSFVAENKMEPFSHFYPFLSQDQLKSFYHAAAWFILPSIKETWGLVVNEAMASGLPILTSTKVGCKSTLLKEGLNGFSFSPHDEIELLKLLLQLDEMDKKKWLEMGKVSKQIISSWDLDRFCSGVYDAIQFVLISRRRITCKINKILIRIWKGRYRPV